MTTLPLISRALDVEMIRDGGSYAATFSEDSGGRHIVFTKIKTVRSGDLVREIVGYEIPFLIDCDPTKRPANTANKTFGDLSGPETPITWAQARTFMALTGDLVEGLDKLRRKWLEQMNYVVATDGGVPLTIEKIRQWKRLGSTSL